ncbi:TRAP transporter substrate-binding protein, partial [Thermodesulfobacteriota bacterium]
RGYVMLLGKRSLKILSVLIGLAIIFTFTNQSIDAFAKSGKPILCKFATVAGFDHPRVRAMEYFKYLVENASKGQIKVEIYHSASLGKARESIEGIRLGTMEMNIGDLLTKYDPRLDVTTLPYLFRDRAHAWNVLDGPIGKDLTSKVTKFGIRLFSNGAWENGFRQMTNNKRAIHSPADLKGLKVRVVSTDLYRKTMEAYGTLTTSIAFSELFTALQTGVIDGQDNPYTHIYNKKFFEVQKYIAETNHIYSIIWVMASEKWYQSLPDKLKKIVYWAVGESTALNRWLMQQKDLEFKAKIKAERKDIVITEPKMEPFKKIAKEKIWPFFEEKVGKDLIRKIENY